MIILPGKKYRAFPGPQDGITPDHPLTLKRDGVLLLPSVWAWPHIAVPHWEDVSTRPPHLVNKDALIRLQDYWETLKILLERGMLFAGGRLSLLKAGPQKAPAGGGEDLQEVYYEGTGFDQSYVTWSSSPYQGAHTFQETSPVRTGTYSFSYNTLTGWGDSQASEWTGPYVVPGDWTGWRVYAYTARANGSDYQMWVQGNGTGNGTELNNLSSQNTWLLNDYVFTTHSAPTDLNRLNFGWNGGETDTIYFDDSEFYVPA